MHLAKGIALNCVRNTSIERIHAGRVPEKADPNCTNLFVTDGVSMIPWNEASRITDEEMKELMIEITNKIFTVLMNLEDEYFIQKFDEKTRRSTIGWNEPLYLSEWFK